MSIQQSEFSSNETPRREFALPRNQMIFQDQDQGQDQTQTQDQNQGQDQDQDQDQGQDQGQTQTQDQTQTQGQTQNQGQGPLQDENGYTIQELMSADELTKFLKDDSKIRILPDDLLRLNGRPSILNKQSHWRDIQISPDVAKLALIVSQLPHLPQSTIQSIILSLGHQLEKSNGVHLNTIRSYLRQKLDLVTRDLKRVSSIKGPAPNTKTLGQAIVEGYSFDLNQYIDEFKQLLNYNSVPQPYLEAFANLVQTYPEFYTLIHEYHWVEDNLARDIIKLYYEDEPNAFQVLYSFSINYPLVIPEDPEITQRRKALSDLPTPYIQALNRIYGKMDIDDILKKEKHPLENYLISIRASPVDRLRGLVSGFGMMVPEHLENRAIRFYILNHISEYRNVITRPNNVSSISQKITSSPHTIIQLIEQLDEYTDFEIMEYFGYTGGFENRNFLILNIFETISEEGFILFKEYDPNRTINTETSILTPLNEIPKPYLVFGTPFEYRVVELDELIAGFIEENNRFIFNRSDSKDQYTISQVSQLQVILASMKYMNPQLAELIDQLMMKIGKGIVMNLETNAEVDQFNRELITRDQILHDQIKQFFFLIFYSGMYMRKWKGPGHLYPSQSSQTITKVNPEPQVILTLNRVITSLLELKQNDPEIHQYLTQTRVVNYLNGIVQFESDYLIDIINKILVGKTCIRQISRKLIITASYYLGVLFGQYIPDFNPHSLDPIG